MICDENCEADGFKKYYWCYKCEDKYFGNPGCVGEKGCTYISDNDQLNCNECKVGYFEYTPGQCFHCKEGDKHCKECGNPTVLRGNKHLYFKLSAFQKQIEDLGGKAEVI